MADVERYKTNTLDSLMGRRDKYGRPVFGTQALPMGGGSANSDSSYNVQGDDKNWYDPLGASYGQSVNLNGKQYARVGAGYSEGVLDEWEQRPGMTYDPEYGYLAETGSPFHTWLNQEKGQEKSFLGRFGPLLAGGILAGVASPAFAAGAGGAEAGAFNAGAGAFDAGGLTGTGIPEAWGAGGSGTGITGGTGMDFANSGFNALDPSTWYGQGGGLDLATGIDGGSLSGGFQTVPTPTGAPFQPGFELFNPATYGGAAGGAMPSGISSLVQKLLGGAGPAGAGAGSGLMSSLFGEDVGDALSGLFPNANLGGLLSGLGQAGLGYLGANQQADALRDTQNQWLQLGAPSRERYEQSFSPNFSIWNEPGTRDAAGRAADIAARSYSATSGNPFDQPAAQAGIYNSVLSGVALPQLNTYRSQNLTGGQLGTNVAGTASLQGADSAGGGLNAIGYGLGTAMNPQMDLQKMLQQFGGMNNGAWKLGGY